MPAETMVDLNRIADRLAKVWLDFVRASTRTAAMRDPDRLGVLEGDVRHSARLAFQRLRGPLPRLQVLVTSSDLRDSGPSETITRLKLKISEQGLEWTSIERDGAPVDRLVPE